MIYVGSSWKNSDFLDIVHAELRKEGFTTWDFRNNGFWLEGLEDKCGTSDINILIEHKLSKDAYQYDLQGLKASDIGLFILPSGISTALEVGYMCGMGKKVVTYGDPRGNSLDIMWRMVTQRFNSKFKLSEVIQFLKTYPYHA